jgi:hypothetical protein
VKIDIFLACRNKPGSVEGEEKRKTIGIQAWDASPAEISNHIANQIEFHTSQKPPL